MGSLLSVNDILPERKLRDTPESTGLVPIQVNASLSLERSLQCARSENVAEPASIHTAVSCLTVGVVPTAKHLTGPPPPHSRGRMFSSPSQSLHFISAPLKIAYFIFPVLPMKIKRCLCYTKLQLCSADFELTSFFLWALRAVIAGRERRHSRLEWDLPGFTDGFNTLGVAGFSLDGPGNVVWSTTQLNCI